MLVFSIMALASAAGAMWGLQKTDDGLTNIEDTTQQLADELMSVSDIRAIVVLFVPSSCSRLCFFFFSHWLSVVSVLLCFYLLACLVGRVG